MAGPAAHLEVKIFVDKEKSRVLFAEAAGDFVDILFSFLTLPLGTIVRLIGKTQPEPSTLGCFTTLYQSVMNLGNKHFCAEEFKDMLLHPRSSSECYCRKLKINVDDTKAKYFLCQYYDGQRYTSYRCNTFMSIYRNAVCPFCQGSLKTVKQVEDSEYTSKGKVFVTKAIKFMISDDLRVIPVVPGAVIGLLSNLGVNDMNVIEERTVNLGLNEVLELLKLTLLSTTPLTDLFLSNTKQNLNSVPKKLSGEKRRVDDSRDQEDMKINVTVVLKKSNKEFLFVEAGHDFMDFMVSFLVIPLGEVLHIMEGRSCLGCIDGLHKSAQSLDSQYFVSEDVKKFLIRPKPAPHFNRVNNLFPLESTPVSCVHIKLNGVEGSGGFLKGETMFFVLDDMTVVPFSAAASAVDIYKRFNISASDLEAQTISIGMAEVCIFNRISPREGISILRSSLTSTCALSNGILHNSLVFKEPKEEK